MGKEAKCFGRSLVFGRTTARFATPLQSFNGTNSRTRPPRLFCRRTYLSGLDSDWTRSDRCRFCGVPVWSVLATDASDRDTSAYTRIRLICLVRCAACCTWSYRTGIVHRPAPHSHSRTQCRHMDTRPRLSKRAFACWLTSYRRNCHGSLSCHPSVSSTGARWTLFPVPPP